MVTKQLSIAIAISICIGSGLAWSDLKTFAAAPASETKIDFDQVFADATRQGEFSPSIHDGLRRVGYFILTTTEPVPILRIVNRAGKSDRLPNFNPRYRNLHPPTASQWHPRSPIRSWAALLAAATHNMPPLSRLLLPPVRRASAPMMPQRVHTMRGPNRRAQYRAPPLICINEKSPPPRARLPSEGPP